MRTPPFLPSFQPTFKRECIPPMVWIWHCSWTLWVCWSLLPIPFFFFTPFYFSSFILSPFPLPQPFLLGMAHPSRGDTSGAACACSRSRGFVCSKPTNWCSLKHDTRWSIRIRCFDGCRVVRLVVLVYVGSVCMCAVQCVFVF